ncbi:MAG: FtsH protease activity modulator HflK [Thiothrix sp.]|jgi:membrane protease subunit HflK|uniref:FtsH protease activity modulator HflK n=1 Tax=Thiothrix sp. TaxID=1032 RepID=UPI002636036B|nr:FtsH protease activity modulator HflK [Thiothrix sp.]MDD5393714.1 FtsH protease activity modulator HflK [Thiothrix sp.]
MPWNEPGGDQKDPWTGKKRGSSNDPEEFIRKLTQKLGGLFGSGDGSDGNNNGTKGIALLLTLVVAGWLLSGIYTVDARQQGLVLRFGAFQEIMGAGLHWHLPYPVETVEIIDVEQNRSAQDRSTMLTKDENIVEIGVSVQYKIRNAQEYAFNVKDVDSNDQSSGTLYQVMRGATREVVGRNDMDFILKEGREQIAGDAQALMQKVLDDYKSGLQVLKVNLTYAEAPTEVKEAFDDANKARENANQFKNEAETYSNKVLPEARGKAARLLEEANAKRQEAIDRAEGDAARFTQLVAAYRKAPEITRERLYLETMEAVMGGSRKVVVDATKGNNMIYLPMTSSNDPAAAIAADAVNNAAAATAAKTAPTANAAAGASKTPSDTDKTEGEIVRGTDRESSTRGGR